MTEMKNVMKALIAITYLMISAISHAQTFSTIDSINMPENAKGNYVLGIYYDYGLGEPYSIRSTTELTTKSSSAGEYGLNIGYQFAPRHKFQIGIFTGVGMTTSTINLEYEDYDYAVNTDADVDGDSYIRHYQDLRLSEKIKTSDICIPLYMDFEYDFYKSFSFYVNLGVKLHICQSRKSDGISGSAYIYGVYPQYDNLTLNENWGFNGFGHKTLKDDLNGDIESANIMTDLFFGIGLRYAIPHTPFTMDLGINYINGNTNAIQVRQEGINKSDVNSSNSIVYNTISEAESTEHLRSLSTACKSIRHDTFRVHASLLFKF